MKLYFVRHGESQANTQMIISNRNLTHSLTEAGRRQVFALAERLRKKSINRIFTSPILRAFETAEILAARLSIPMECAEALREPDCGILEGRKDEGAWEEHNSWKNKWLKGHERDRGPEGGETYNEIQKRFADFIESLLANNVGKENGILLVTHGALILFALPGVCINLDAKSILDHGLEFGESITIESQKGDLTFLGWE